MAFDVGQLGASAPVSYASAAAPVPPAAGAPQYDVGGQQVGVPQPDPRDALLAFLLQHVHAQAQQGQHPLDSLAAVLSGAHAVAPHPGRLPAAPRFGHLPHPFVAPTY